MVLGYQRSKNKLRVVRRESIKKNSSEDPVLSKHLQEESIGRIIANFHAFSPLAVYVDKGYGGFQAETLEKYFYEIERHEVFKAIDFGSAYRDTNPITGEPRSRSLKGVMVYSLQRQFDLKRIEISPLEEGRIEDVDASFEDKLTYQLNNYVVDHYTNRDEPVFAHKGDHALDAFMVANFGFMEKIENSLNFAPEYGSGIMFSKAKAVPDVLEEGKESLRSGFMKLINRSNEEIYDFGAPKKLLTEQEQEEVLDITSFKLNSKDSGKKIKVRRGRFC